MSVCIYLSTTLAQWEIRMCGLISYVLWIFLDLWNNFLLYLLSMHAYTRKYTTMICTQALCSLFFIIRTIFWFFFRPFVDFNASPAYVCVCMYNNYCTDCEGRSLRLSDTTSLRKRKKKLLFILHAIRGLIYKHQNLPLKGIFSVCD